MIDEALDVLTKGLNYHPNYSLAHLVQGKCFFDKRMFVQAKESFEKTISFDPQNIIALKMLAQTCESLKDEPGQISAYKIILAIDPSDEAAQAKLIRLEAAQKKAPLYTIAMAQEYEKQQNLSEALAIYDYLLATDPTDLVLQEKVTEIRQKVGERKRTIEEEKIEGLQLETYFRPEELTMKEESRTAPPHPVPEELKDIEIEKPSPIIEEPIKHEEKVLSVEDFLSEGSNLKSEESKIESPVQDQDIVDILHTQETTKIDEYLLDSKKIEMEEKEKESKTIPTKEEPTSAKTPNGPAPSAVEEKKAPEVSEKPKTESEQAPKKPNEEDFQSFQEWLSGLLK